MKKNTYKILVLSDLKKSTANVLKSAVSLAKMIDAEIHCFHVRKPIDIVEIDNQLSAMRAINSEYLKVEKKIQQTIDSISKEFGVDIPYTFAFGNTKDEIESFVSKTNPDIIVLGKRKAKALKVIGDKITDYILKTHDGVIMIAGNENTLEPDKALSLGVLNDMLKDFNIAFAENLLEHTQKPLKSFKIVKSVEDLKESKNQTLNPNALEYVFQQSDNDLKNLSRYLTKSKVNLFCMRREKKNTLAKTQINDAIDKLGVSILLSSNRSKVKD